MWELSSAMVFDKGKVEEYLRDGYEPFAVTMDIRGERVWLKRIVKDSTKESTDEVPDKPKQPVRRTGNRTAPDSKG